MSAQNNERIAEISKELILFVIQKYNIKSYDDFSCQIMKKLAIELNIFP